MSAQSKAFFVKKEKCFMKKCLSAPYSRNKTTLVTNTNQPPVEPYYKVNKVGYMCAYSVTEVVSLGNNVKMRLQKNEEQITSITHCKTGETVRTGKVNK